MSQPFFDTSRAKNSVDQFFMKQLQHLEKYRGLLAPDEYQIIKSRLYVEFAELTEQLQ